MSTIDQA